METGEALAEMCGAMKGQGNVPKEDAARFTPSFDQLVADYRNEGEVNDRIHGAFEEATWHDALLAEHRQHVERNKLGFGDAAFHSMWARILESAVQRHGTVRALEIGVFKGQVISLWALLAKTHGWPLHISCISPMAGNPPPSGGLRHRLRLLFSQKYREEFRNGNFYQEEDYRSLIEGLFGRFGIDFSDVTVFRGFSTDPEVIRKTETEKFEIIYVDGDHTFAGASHDFKTFGPKVVKGGWLIADDAGCALPGSTFWKGHQAVSEAVEILPSLGFRNVLNVGHNRIYEKIA